jgi:hypothetical protein
MMKKPILQQLASSKNHHNRVIKTPKMSQLADIENQHNLVIIQYRFYHCA